MEEQTNLENTEDQKTQQVEPAAEALLFEPIRDLRNSIHTELSKVIVGQVELIDLLILPSFVMDMSCWRVCLV